MSKTMETKTYTCTGCKRVAIDWKCNPEDSCPRCEDEQDPQELEKLTAILLNK